MKQRLLFLYFLLPIAATAQLTYPASRKTETHNSYAGKYKVADPYNWLEDDNSEETKNWVKEQNKVTFNYLSTIPVREKVKKRLEELWNYPKYSSPFKKGNYYYFFKNDGLQNQAILYRQLGMAGKPEVFLDPNKLSKE